MRKHLKWIIPVVVVLGIVGGIVGLTLWRSAQDQQRRLAFAEELLRSERADDAIQLLRNEDRPRGAEDQQRFGELQVEALRQSGQIGQLRQLYYTSPSFFKNNEEASLLVARALLNTEDETTCSAICEAWRNRRQLESEWFALQVDQALREGDRLEASRLLENAKFDGKDDFGRLSRLALLNSDQPDKAWEYLEKAFEIDPANPTLRLFRGNLLEAAGKRRAARVEYVAAYLAAPSDVMNCDQLAEFYRRTGNHAAAQRTWAELPEESTSDFIELKRHFWSRLTAGLEGEKRAAPPGPWKALTEYLAELPPSRFWHEEEFSKLQGSATLTKLRQEPYWLRLMQMIKDSQGQPNRLRAIQQFIVENRVSSTVSYSNDLQRALTLTVAYQLKSNFDADIVREGARKESRRHQFLDQLDNAHYDYSQNRNDFKLPEDLDALLKDSNAFAIVAMTAGWTEAAVRLDTGKPIDARAPAWAAYGMTQAFRMNRGTDEALAYAKRQTPTPLLSLLIGELHIANGDWAEAEASLSELAKETTDQGVRAAWLLAMSQVDAGRLSDAEATVERNDRLAVSSLGQEVIAKIALLRGDHDGAHSLYTSIQSESFEARAFAARLAYANKDWDKAERLTQDLLTQMPDSMQLRANLQAIDGARMNEAK